MTCVVRLVGSCDSCRTLYHKLQPLSVVYEHVVYENYARAKKPSAPSALHRRCVRARRRCGVPLLRYCTDYCRTRSTQTIVESDKRHPIGGTHYFMCARA